MKIGIIGSGSVGGTLGRRWAANGHTVVFASRHPQSDEMKKLLGSAGPSASAGSVAEAARNSDIILLATPWPATRESLANAGDLTGKILIDATNPIRADFGGLEVGTDNSGGELVAQWAPGARVVKAFNTVGFNIMADPRLSGGSARLFYCGDDPDAKKVVRDLATELGFDALDVGPLKQARLLEPLAMLWVSLAFSGHGREFAFGIVKRS